MPRNNKPPEWLIGMAGLPEPQLLGAIRRLSRRNLLYFRRRYFGRECSCRLRFLEQRCRCGSLDQVLPRLGVGLPEAQQKAAELAAQTLVLELLDPRRYREPRAPRSSTYCATTTTKSVIMAERRRRGLRIWHPADYLQTRAGVDERLERLAGGFSRQGNDLEPGEVQAVDPAKGASDDVFADLPGGPPGVGCSYREGPAAARQRRRLAAGLCRMCGVKRDRTGSLCRRCCDKYNAAHRKWRRERSAG